MKNYEKLIKKLVIVLLFIIVIIISLLIILNKKQQTNSEFSAEEGLGIIRETEFKDVQSPTMFYTVENIVENYLDYIHLNYEKESINERIQTLADKYEIYDEEQKLSEIIKLLDTRYIKENNITIENLNNYANIDKDEVSTVNVVRMKVLEEEQFQFYTINVVVTTESSKKYNEYYVVILDDFNSSWMIRPINNCNNIDEIKVDKNVESIDNDSEIPYENITDSEMAEIYFIKYKQLILNNSKEAYEKLDKQYRDKRFNNYESFEQYINNNKQQIEKLSVDEYLLNEYEDYKEYVCKDEYENIFKFKASSIINYTVELDTYTIITEEFSKEYNQADAQNKVMMNIDRWIKMLNNRDYKAAFNMLDETFRNNNFNGDVNVFEAYMRSKYPAYYEIKYTGFTERPGDVYSQGIILTEISEESTTEQEMTIIMKLQEGTNFVMSFNIEQ